MYVFDVWVKMIAATNIWENNYDTLVVKCSKVVNNVQFVEYMLVERYCLCMRAVNYKASSYIL